MLKIIQSERKFYYGWVVVIAFAIISTILWGLRFSFGVFFKSIEGEFELTRAATSSVFSAYMVLGTIFVVLGGWALDKYGPRIVVLLMGITTGLGLLLTSQINSLWQLYFTYSLLLAMGTSSIYMVIMASVSRWFNKKRGLALGIASLGAGSGTVLMSPLATYLITTFDWRMAFLVIGIIALLIVVPLSRLLKNEPSEIDPVSDGKEPGLTDKKSLQENNGTKSLHLKGLSLFQAFKTKSLVMFILMYFLIAFSSILVLTHIVPHVIDMGFSVGEAATVLSLIGVGNSTGRVLMGIVADKIGRKISAIICNLVQSLAMVWLLWSDELWMLVLFAIVFGFTFGGRGPIMGALIGDSFGLKRIGSILGITEVGFGIGAAIGPAVGGLIFDFSRNYSAAFLSTIAALLIVAVLTTQVKQEKSPA
ncbi:MFS transporter [Chloroflexota bacterium]